MFQHPEGFDRLSRRMRRKSVTAEPVDLPPIGDVLAAVNAAIAARRAEAR